MPSFVVEPRSVEVVAGGTLELMCILEPKTADIGWTRNGQAVVIEGGQLARGGVLRLNNMAPALAGNYECIASTPYGSIVSSTAKVQIAGKDCQCLFDRVFIPLVTRVQWCSNILV